MLNTSKTINLNGNSMIDGQLVMTMYASINTQSVSGNNINYNVQNQELYASNREQVRADMREFETEVYKIEDSLMSEINIKA